MDLLENIRMSLPHLVEAYNDYLKGKDAKQVTFDEFCDEVMPNKLN